MRLGIHGAVVVILYGDFGESFAAAAEAMEIAIGGHGEDTGRSESIVLVRMTALPTEPAHRTVFELLDSGDQHDIVHAGGDGHSGVAEGVCAGGAVILDARDRFAIETQGVGQRDGGFAVP